MTVNFCGSCSSPNLFFVSSPKLQRSSLSYFLGSVLVLNICPVLVRGRVRLGCHRLFSSKMRKLIPIVREEVLFWRLVPFSIYLHGTVVGKEG